jgi:hypothetical protein
LHYVQQLVGDRLNARAHTIDQAGRERLLDQRTQPLVVGRVRVEHVPGEGLHHFRYRRYLDELFRGHGVAPILHETLVFQHGGDIFVAGNQPHAPTVGQRHAMDRGLGAQPSVGGIGIRSKFGIE